MHDSPQLAEWQSSPWYWGNHTGVTEADKRTISNIWYDLRISHRSNIRSSEWCLWRKNLVSFWIYAELCSLFDGYRFLSPSSRDTYCGRYLHKTIALLYFQVLMFESVDAVIRCNSLIHRNESIRSVRFCSLTLESTFWTVMLWTEHHQTWERPLVSLSWIQNLFNNYPSLSDTRPEGCDSLCHSAIRFKVITKWAGVAHIGVWA